MATKRARAWTREDDEKLVVAFEGGVPFSAIAKELDRTEASVLRRIYSLKEKRIILRARKSFVYDWSPIEDTYIAKSLAEGIPLKEMALALDRSPTLISKRVQDLGLGEVWGHSVDPLSGLLHVRNEGHKAVARLDTIWSKKRPTGAADGASPFRRGYRPHLKVSVRSSWENNVLVWMNHKKIKWEYEPKIFMFEQIARGTRSYIPDVYLPKEDIWIEIKGRLTIKDRTKANRFRKYYPEEFAKLQVITKNETDDATEFYTSLGVPVYAYYNDLVKEYKHTLKHWES